MRFFPNRLWRFLKNGHLPVKLHSSAPPGRRICCICMVLRAVFWEVTWKGPPSPPAKKLFLQNYLSGGHFKYWSYLTLYCTVVSRGTLSNIGCTGTYLPTRSHFSSPSARSGYRFWPRTLALCIIYALKFWKRIIGIAFLSNFNVFETQIWDLYHYTLLQNKSCGGGGAPPPPPKYRNILISQLKSKFREMIPQWLQAVRKNFKLLKYEHIIYRFEARDLKISNM